MPSDLRAMDSLSQIVLGAAVGEAVLGRRIGNRAMIWGAVAGTIPDMDVLGKYVLSELDNLGFHRASAIHSCSLFWGLWSLGGRPTSCTAAATTPGSPWAPRRPRRSSWASW